MADNYERLRGGCDVFLYGKCCGVMGFWVTLCQKIEERIQRRRRPAVNGNKVN